MKQYKGYLGTVEYDDKARILHGEVLGVRDVIAFQADRASASRRRFAIRWTTTSRFARSAARSRTSRSPASSWCGWNEKLHRELSLIAQRTGQSLNGLVTEYLRREAQQALPDACEKPENVLA